MILHLEGLHIQITELAGDLGNGVRGVVLHEGFLSECLGIPHRMLSAERGDSSERIHEDQRPSRSCDDRREKKNRIPAHRQPCDRGKSPGKGIPLAGTG